MALAYRREIDGLRAIAVLAVVLYHAGVGPPVGFAGVDVFFVISGYLITALLLREHADTGQIDLIAFYARRVRRIFPAAAVVVLATVVLSSLVLLPAEIVSVARSAAAAAVFVANFFFQTVTGDYFDADADQMPLLHLWSLSVEEQFYLFWPAVLVVLLRSKSRPAPMLGVIALASFALAEFLMRINPEAAFYQMPARFWELAAGALVAAIPTRAAPRGTATAAIIAVIAACVFPFSHFPGIGALPAVASTALLLWALHTGATSRFLASRPMVAIGRVSYSFYLWHWPLLAIYAATAAGTGNTSTRLLLCAVALVLAAASYRYVEQPFRRIAWPKRRLVVGGMVAAGVLGVSFFAFAFVVQREAIGNDNPAAVKAERDLPPDWFTCHYQKGTDPRLRESCEFPRGGQPKIVMWGDSMAMAWKPLAWGMSRESNKAGIDYSRDACGPFITWMPRNSSRDDERCRDWNRLVLARAQRADTVVLVSRWVTNGDDLDERLRPTLLALARVPRVIIMGPTPELPDTVPNCFRKQTVQKCFVPRSQFQASAAPMRAKLASAAAGLPNVLFLDPTDFFCTKTECGAMNGPVALYWDNHHPSATATASFAYFHARELAAP